MQDLSLLIKTFKESKHHFLTDPEYYKDVGPINFLYKFNPQISMHTVKVHVNRKRNIVVAVPYKGGSQSVDNLFLCDQTKQWEFLEDAENIDKDPIWQDDPEMHVVARDPLIKYLSYLKWDHNHLIWNFGRFLHEDELLGKSAAPQLAGDQHLLPQIIGQRYRFDENFFIALRNNQERIVESLSMPDDPLNIKQYFTTGLNQNNILRMILNSAYYNREVFDLDNLVTHKTKYYWVYNDTQANVKESSESARPGYINDDSQNFIINLKENLSLDIAKESKINFMMNHGNSSTLDYFAHQKERSLEMRKYYQLDYDWISTLKFENIDNPSFVS